jgi:hypothetical protein
VRGRWLKIDWSGFGGTSPWLRLRNLRMTCSMLPSQWEATNEVGELVYIRFRFGALSVRIGGTEEWAGADGPIAVYLHHGDEWAGVMETDEMLSLTAMEATP